MYHIFMDKKMYEESKTTLTSYVLFSLIYQTWTKRQDMFTNKYIIEFKNLDLCLFEWGPFVTLLTLDS